MPKRDSNQQPRPGSKGKKIKIEDNTDTDAAVDGEIENRISIPDMIKEEALPGTVGCDAFELENSGNDRTDLVEPVPEVIQGNASKGSEAENIKQKKISGCAESPYMTI
jgi:hypothetical protein